MVLDCDVLAVSQQSRGEKQQVHCLWQMPIGEIGLKTCKLIRSVKSGRKANVNKDRENAVILVRERSLLT